MKKRIICILLCAVICLSLVTVGAAGASKSDFYSQAKLLNIRDHIEKDAGMGTYATVQGACTDGKYAYFAIQGGTTMILKYDTSSWELTEAAPVSGLGHANDMTYNSDKDYIVVANNYSSDDILTLLHPKTLKVIGTVTPKMKKTDEEIQKEAKKQKVNAEEIDPYKRIKIYSIAYNPDIKRYVAGLSGTYNFALLYDDFTVDRVYDGVKTGYTRQGVDCDANYIYFPQSDGANLIVIYDYEGKHVDTISIGHSHEVENLFHIGSCFYTTLHYYGNSVQRIGMSDATRIRFTVTYDPDTGYGEMKNTSVTYGKDTKLRACTYQKDGYFFGGWRAQRSQDDKLLGFRAAGEELEWLDEKELEEYHLYQDQATVAKTVKFGSVKLTAFWINEYYPIYYEAQDAVGWMDSAYVAYDEAYTLPENAFEKEGFVFSGYTAYRSADDKYYGYAKGSKQPRWLSEENLYKDFLFQPGDAVSRLTYDGAVTLSPEFRFAYTFSGDYTALLEYIGVDETAQIPDPEGCLNTIDTGAFNSNEPLKTIVVPDTVTTVAPAAIQNCPNLRQITFTDSFPASFDKDFAEDCEDLAIVRTQGEAHFFLGVYTESGVNADGSKKQNASATFIRNSAKNLDVYLNRVE